MVLMNLAPASTGVFSSLTPHMYIFLVYDQEPHVMLQTYLHFFLALMNDISIKKKPQGEMSNPPNPPAPSEDANQGERSNPPAPSEDAN